MLYVCATPIGNLGDVSPRVLDALREAELVAAEDTRRTRKLLSHFDIHSHLTSFFQHNELQKTDEVLRLLRGGGTVALVTDAGMPGVQDPGMLLVQKVVAEGLDMTVLPGPSAVLTALVAAGISGDGFRFIGLPAAPGAGAGARLDRVADLRRARHRLRHRSAAAEEPRGLAAHLPDARAAVCRELTKVHEEVARGTVLELSERYPAPSPDAGITASLRERSRWYWTSGGRSTRQPPGGPTRPRPPSGCSAAASRAATRPRRSTCASASRGARPTSSCARSPRAWADGWSRSRRRLRRAAGRAGARALVESRAWT